MKLNIAEVAEGKDGKPSLAVVQSKARVRGASKLMPAFVGVPLSAEANAQVVMPGPYECEPETEAVTTVREYDGRSFTVTELVVRQIVSAKPLALPTAPALSGGSPLPKA